LDKKVSELTSEDLKNPKIQATLLAEIRRHGEEAELKDHEIPKLLLLTSEEWSPQNRLLTVSFKVVRAKVIARYKDQILACYGQQK
jgi:long-subunit acyl-CoA synthetase (AMP-forming)